MKRTSILEDVPTIATNSTVSPKRGDFAKFEIVCDAIGYRRSHEIPIDARGYVRQLAEDLDRALELYQLRIENHRLKQEGTFGTKQT